MESFWEDCQKGNTSFLKSFSPHPLSPLDVNWSNPNCSWMTALHVACQNGHLSIVRLLLSHPDIDVNKTNSLGSFPLFSACWKGHLEIVKLLLHDPRVDVNLTDNQNRTPLWVAASSGQTEMFKWILTLRRETKLFSPQSLPLKTKARKDVMKRQDEMSAVVALYRENPSRSREGWMMEAQRGDSFAGEVFSWLVLLCDGFVNLPKT